MWCIGTLTEEYRLRMYDLLELYAEPLRIGEPVVCIDEKSLQLLSHSRGAAADGLHSPAKDDYEYVRKGTTNLFVAIEPKAGKERSRSRSTAARPTSSPSSTPCSAAPTPRPVAFTSCWTT